MSLRSIRATKKPIVNAPPPVLFGRRRVRPRLLTSLRRRTNKSPRARGTPGCPCTPWPCGRKVVKVHRQCRRHEMPGPRRSARGVSRLAPYGPRWLVSFRRHPLGLSSRHRCRRVPERPRLAEQSVRQPIHDAPVATSGPHGLGRHAQVASPPHGHRPNRRGCRRADPEVNALHLQRAAPAVPAFKRLERALGLGRGDMNIVISRNKVKRR
jgi:hypothetical protein